MYRILLVFFLFSSATFGVEIQVGIPTREQGNVWKPGCWTMVRVSQIPEECETLRVTAVDSDGVPMVISAPVVFGGAEVAVRPGHEKTTLEVELYRGDAPIWHQTVLLENPVSASRRVVLVVGGTTEHVERAAEHLHVPGEERPCFFQISDAASLPAETWAWEIVDTLVVFVPNDAARTAWTPESLETLAEWVRQGGFLLVSMGEQAAHLSADWNAFLPGAFQKKIPMPQTSALEHEAKSTVPVPLLGVTEEYRIPVAQFRDLRPEAVVQVKQFDLPLVFSMVNSFGRVKWVAFDLEHPAMTRWGDVGLLWARLLEYTDRSADYERTAVAGLHDGYDDMAGQMRSALDFFADVPQVSFWTLSGLFALYLIGMGPGCFWVCRKFFKGGEIASWSLFLVCVVGTCGVLYFLSLSSLPAERMNRLAVTDVDMVSGKVRQTIWGTLWTANSGRQTVALKPEGNATQSAVGWMGLPGNFLGGMASNTASVVATPKANEAGCTVQPTQLVGLPTLPRATKCLTATRWTTALALFGETVSSFGTLEDQDAIPYGVVRNPLKVPLEHAVLVYGGWAYDLREIPANGEVTIDDTLRRYDVTSVLVDAAFIEEASHDKDKKIYRRIVLPYDSSSRDLEYLGKTMLFYTSVGGRAYTGLENRYQFWTDATALLRSGRAVLYGRVRETTSQTETDEIFLDWTLAGQRLTGKSVRLLRIFIPVEKK